MRSSAYASGAARSGTSSPPERRRRLRVRSMATFAATRQAHGAAYGSTVRQRTYVLASASCATSSASARSPSSRNATLYEAR